MTTEEVLQAVRAFFKAAPFSLTDEQVIPADAAGVRPAGAHITVKVQADVSTDGPNAVWVLDGGTPEIRVTDHRRATISVVSYGYEMTDAITTASALWCTPHPASDVARALGLHPGTASTVTDVSTAVDGSWEERQQMTMIGYHRNTPAPAEVGAVGEIVLDMTLEPGAVPVQASTTEIP